MLFSVGDLVKRTWNPRDLENQIGIVVKIIKTDLRRNRKQIPQAHLTLMVRWLYPTIYKEEEPYWVEDLEIISKAKQIKNTPTF